MNSHIFSLILCYCDFILAIDLFLFVNSAGPEEVPLEKIDLKRNPFPKVVFQFSWELPKSALKFLGEFMERFVLCKITCYGYWNNVSSNLRIFAVLQLSGLITGLGVLSGLDQHPALIFAGSFAGIFWQERSAYYAKWSYLAGLYNELVKAKHFVKAKQLDQNSTAASNKELHSYRESLKFALVHDIIQMEMWSHESFRHLFKEALSTAFSFREKVLEEPKILKGISNLTKQEAISLIDNYQERAIDIEKNNYIRSVS